MSNNDVIIRSVNNHCKLCFFSISSENFDGCQIVNCYFPNTAWRNNLCTFLIMLTRKKT